MAVGNLVQHAGLVVWPPSSPDCNPLEFFAWGVVERETNKSSCNNKDEVKIVIRVFSGLLQQTVTKACGRF